MCIRDRYGSGPRDGLEDLDARRLGTYNGPGGAYLRRPATVRGRPPTHLPRIDLLLNDFGRLGEGRWTRPNPGTKSSNVAHFTTPKTSPACLKHFRVQVQHLSLIHI